MTITAPSAEMQALAEARQSMLLKPRGSLGRLEALACWFAARQRREIPEALRPAITVFAADHGIARNGVSAYPQSVTAEMLKSLSSGVAAINVLARSVDAPLTVVDVGVASDVDPPPGIANERIARGTRDMSTEPAMTRDEAQRALDVGARHAREAIARGATLLIAGEVGIGNTTTAACLAAALIGVDPEQVVGHGSGINAEQRKRKVDIARQALARSRPAKDTIGLLADLGGFEIAAMAGFYLEAARASTPCVLDGFISAAAALVTRGIDERAMAWLLASHRSVEPGHALVLRHLGLEPLIDFELRLGEGSGAALIVPMLQAAVRLHAEMATFAEAGVPDKI